MSRSRTVERLAIPAMVVVGALVALQSTINGRLAHELGTGTRAGVLAAVVSFGSGLVILVVTCAATPGLRRGVAGVAHALRDGRLRPWQGIGGAAGATLVAAQGLTVPAIGVALFTVAVVAGQTSSALAVDRAGLGPSGPRAISPGRVLGALVTLAAVATVVLGRLGGPAALTVGAALLALLPLVAGGLTSWQQAVNGRVSAVGGPIPAALLNFVVGTVVLLALLGISFLAPGHLAEAPPSQWWLYTGGALGCVFIATSALLVRVLGVLVLSLAAVAGQVVTSVVIDAVTGMPVGTGTLVGAATALVGVGIGAWASGARTAQVAPPARRAETETDAEAETAPETAMGIEAGTEAGAELESTGE